MGPGYSEWRIRPSNAHRTDDRDPVARVDRLFAEHWRISRTYLKVAGVVTQKELLCPSPWFATHLNACPS